MRERTYSRSSRTVRNGDGQNVIRRRKFRRNLRAILIRSLRDQLKEIASGLDEKVNIPMVQQQIVLEEIQTDENAVH